MTDYLPTTVLAVSAPAEQGASTGATAEPGVVEPGLRPGLEQSDVTPGIVGFLFTALMVAMVIIVIRLMVRSVRRVQYRSVDAEDMLVERYQGYLPEEARQRTARDAHSQTAADLQRQQSTLQDRYPGYLDGPAPEPRAPDSGRD